MMRSMYSGVSGLRVHQTKMDVIGNNIANVNTTGYKSQRVTFSDVFSQTLQSGTGASDETGRGGRNPMQVGLGVNVSSIDIMMTPGAAQRTDNPFDLMVDGDGFIIVGDDTGKYFTRAGALRQDAEGNLVIPNGMKVQGWPANTEGTDIDRGEVRPIVLTDPTNTTAKPETTSITTLSGNINTKDGLEGIPTQIKMYDSLGNMYTTPVYLVFDPTSSTWSTYNTKDNTTDPPTFGNDDIVLKDTNGKQFIIQGVSIPKTDFKFDNDGKLIKDISVEFKITPQIDLSKAVDSKGNQIGFTAVIGDETDGIKVNFKDITQYSAKTSLDPKTIDGKAPGEMTGFEVGADGKITAHYNNGDTKLLGQIVVANFDNPAGLQKVGDNLFQTTANSGDFDNIGDAANFQAGVLEMSNVDLSSEFTEMITTQRGFQANSRIISVSDEMLQELVNLKR